MLSDQPIDVETARRAARAAYQQGGRRPRAHAQPGPAGRAVRPDVRQAVRDACAAPAPRSRSLALLAVTATASAARAQGLRRFAIVAGNDAGGGDTQSLLYAGADARKVHEILTRLGGVRAGGRDAAARRQRVAAAERDRRGRDAGGARRPGAASGRRCSSTTRATPRTARCGSGETRVPIDGIKARIASSPFDVRIAILDSCRSGAFTRTKGARKAPAFEIQSESPRDAKGLVILTSSTSDEDSQESDAIGGSYFSHHLASGLLGGADRSGDGRVTLFEAYAYAYDRTVADTAESAAGAQHPTFSYDLAGNGDLVLTDVAVRHEGVYFPREAPSGVYFLVDGKGFVAAEISKADGVDRRVALAPGRYRVKRRLPGSAARRRDRRAARPAGRAGGGAAARRAVLRRSGQGRGPRRPDVALVAGRGRHVPIRLRSAKRRQPVPTDRHAGRRLVAAKLFAPRLGLERRPRGRLDRRRRHQRRRAVQVQRDVAGVVAGRRVAGALRDAVRRRPARDAADGAPLQRRRLSRRSSSRRCRRAWSAAPPSAS